MSKIYKVLNVGGIFIFAVYAVYIVGVAIFLNTPLFRQVAKMTEEDQTYVHFSGAVSLFPGYLWSSKARVFIGDQNVSIGIDLQRVRVRFELLPLLDKRLNVTSVEIGGAQVDIGMKTLAESTAYSKKYVRASDLDLKKRQLQALEDEKYHLTLDFQKVHIERLNHVRGGFGEFAGEMSLDGGFLIQPKVHVEVYPSTLHFLSGIVGDAQVQIARFRTVDTPGNAVFPYMTANLDLNVQTSAFKTVDLKMDELPGYSMDGVGSNGSIKLSLVRGVLQKGSTIETLPSALSIHTPGLVASGRGRLHWTVDSDQSSVLTTKIHDLRLSELSASVNSGRVKTADLNLRLYGTELIDAFHGLSMALNLRGLEWKLKSDPRTSKNFGYEGLITGQGQLSGFAGQVPKSVSLRRDTGTPLDLRIDKLDFKTSFASSLSGTGRIQIQASPIDLAANAIQFPKATVDFNLKVGERGEVKSEANFEQLEHRLAPEDSWKGRLVWKMDRTEPLIEALASQTELSGMVQSLAKVRDLEIKMDCEMNSEVAWLRFNQISSTGVWKGYGTLKNQEEGLRGLFEVDVLGVPVGLRIEPEQTEIQFLPSREWYDEYFYRPMVPEKSPRIPLGAAKKASGAI